jgi:hypothetical protein
MALAAEPVEHDAAKADCRTMAGKARGHRRRRLRLPRHVEHQQRRQAEPLGEIRGRAAAAGRAGTPSNSPIAPSITSACASRIASAISASISAGGIAQLSRLTPLAPVAAA